MKKRTSIILVLIGIIGLIILWFSTSAVLRNYYQNQTKKEWSFSKSHATFTNKEAKIQVLKATKIPLQNDNYAVRIHYKITNLTSKTEDGYSLILDTVDKITKNKEEINSVSVIGHDKEEDKDASSVNIAPDETKEVVYDYDVGQLGTPIVIHFRDSDYNIVASYSMKTDNLPNAPLSAIDIPTFPSTDADTSTP